jgi:hypothetical protein
MNRRTFFGWLVGTAASLAAVPALAKVKFPEDDKVALQEEMLENHLEAINSGDHVGKFFGFYDPAKSYPSGSMVWFDLSTPARIHWGTYVATRQIKPGEIPPVPEREGNGWLLISFTSIDSEPQATSWQELRDGVKDIHDATG